MASGLPVVATTAGALPEVLGDAAGFVPPGDAGALATTIASLLDDPPRRERLGRHARDRALERFSWDTTAAETVAEYRRVIASC
jgi:glycosyltransferase involved in cell wall biosynthesis